jgi:hypothetical protein
MIWNISLVSYLCIDLFSCVLCIYDVLFMTYVCIILDGFSGGSVNTGV